MRISKTFDFDAAHHLPMVADGHKCKRMHGHTYRVELICDGPMRQDGMVLDYADIALAWEPMHDALDHRCLNDVEGLSNPTTEVLVVWLLERLPSFIACVRVHESTTTYAEASR
jgi:6-pyruvoyltetrahydropterin/6-carboxytetrahydropterin synthase